MASPSESQFTVGPDLAPVLVGLLRRDGIALLERRDRLNGLLRDYAPTSVRDIRLLLSAHDAGIPPRLGAAADPMAADMLSKEADTMVEAFGCERSLALGAVTTWGRALAGLRDPAGSSPPAALVHVPPAGIASHGVATADEPSLVGRWGGIAFAVLLVLIALIRWVGWL